MASTEQTAEARELSLVGKVEMRIALADSDDKLEGLLKTYLAPLLLKLASPYSSVQNKVVKICSHVNTRIKAPTVNLPVAALVEQYKANLDKPLIRHFDMVYIQQGVRRMSAAESETLFPVVMRGIASAGKQGASQGSSMFNLLLQLLEHFRLPPRGTKEDQELRTTLKIDDEDASYLASWFGKLMLFVPIKSKPGTNTTEVSCPGLTLDEYAFLTLSNKEDTWNPSTPLGLNLTTVKARAARLLASGIFTDKERFFPALFASADPASAVSDAGEDMLKRVIPNADLEDESIIRELFHYFFGSDDQGGRVRARAPLRLKISGLLTKSVRSTEFTHEITQMVNKGITESSTNDAIGVLNAEGASSSSTGREAIKLRAALFTYINFVARYGSKESLYAIAPQVLGRLKDFIEGQGWPRPAGYEDLVSRGYAYEVIGLLAKAGPKDLVVEPNLDILRWMFESLALEVSSNSINVSIEESLSSVLGAFTQTSVTPETATALEDLLIHQMDVSSKEDQKPERSRRSTRYVAVRYANRCLPYQSVKARWVDLLAIAAGPRDRQEVAEEGRRGLNPYWYRMLNGAIEDLGDFTFPHFKDLVDFIFNYAAFDGRTVSENLPPSRVVQQLRSSYSGAFADVIAYCRSMLLHEALKNSPMQIKLDSEWERKLNVTAESDVDVRTAVKQYIQRAWDQSGPEAASLEVLIYAFSTNLLDTEGKSARINEANKLFLDLCALSPDPLVATIAPQYKRLEAAIYSNQHSTRNTAAHAFGILASHLNVQQNDQAQIQHVVSQLLAKSGTWREAIGAASNQVHGATLSLAFYFSRLALRDRKRIEDDSTLDMYVKNVTEITTEATDVRLREAGFGAIAELCLYQVVTQESFSSSETLKKIIDKTADVAKTGNEAASLALGQMAMILDERESGEDTETNLLHHIEDRLHKMHEIRQAEAHFSIGEALSYLACGWQSKALATKMDVDCSVPKGPVREKTLARILEKTLRDCANTKPALRKASVIWLLCLVQFCGHMPEVQQQLAACQVAFKRCLTDRDELVQETASRGLGLVYEKGDRRLKDDLVRDLVGSFSEKRPGQSQLAGTVSGDTQLFEEGALPTGDGSVTTYKDIMSLAAEVGDSSLVYKFMAMASSNAIWSSRAAFGRFGLSSVLSDSSVDGYLADNPKLYPSLYRYRFDPSSTVQRSMNDIWNALVKDSSGTIEKHFDAIMDDLLQNIFGREWRTRQASCAAIADLVQGRSLERYERYLEKIWNACFKVLDDIKESVRAAAASLARVMTGILTRALEADTSASKNAAKMLKHVLPFLLSTSGLESSAQEVQGFALQTLLDIIRKSSGQTLRPFLPELVERLLGLLSSLEPQMVNYLHLNADKYNLTEQKIDDMRLSSIRSSPLMEACERCLDLLDESAMQQLLPRLENAIKTAVGLPSKVGCSRILVSLSTRHNVLFKPHSDHFLRLIERAIVDRNETVASSYAAAAGYVSRGASDKQILHLTAFAKQLYFDSAGDRDQTVPRRSISAGEVMHALSKHASDRFNALAADLIPFIFVAKHDSSEAVKALFQETWDAQVGGPRAVSLYLKEILTLSSEHLDSPQWAVKHTAARAIAGATVAVASMSAGEMEITSAEIVWPVLQRALGGKTWDGKEVVVDAFARFVETGGRMWKPRADVADQILKVSPDPDFFSRFFGCFPPPAGGLSNVRLRVVIAGSLEAVRLLAA